MIDLYKNGSIEAANFMLMFVALYACYRVAIWKYKNHLSEFVGNVVCCWAWVFGAIGVRAGWFALARHTAPDGATWNPVMYDFRFIVINATALACVWGLLRFIQLIDEFSNAKLGGLFILAVILAQLLGYY